MGDRITWAAHRSERIEYLRVARDGTIETIDGITGGRIDEDAGTAIKSSGELDIVRWIDFADDEIQIVVHATEGEHTEKVTLGTFLVATPSWRRGISDEARVVLYSRLQILAEDCVESTYSLNAGTNVIAAAKAIVESAGLSCLTASHTATLRQAMVWKVGTPKLTIVNELLERAGLPSANVDPFGRVVFRVDFEVEATTYTFSPGVDSIITQDFDDEHDWFRAPNVVLVVPSDAEESDLVTAIAINDDPASRLSTIARGRRIVHVATVPDLDSQAALQEHANTLLRTLSAAAHTVKLGYSFRPTPRVGDTVRFINDMKSVDYTCVVQGRSIDLSPGLMTTATLRRV